MPINLAAFRSCSIGLTSYVWQLTTFRISISAEDRKEKHCPEDQTMFDPCDEMIEDLCSFVGSAKIFQLKIGKLEEEPQVIEKQHRAGNEPTGILGEARERKDPRPVPGVLSRLEEKESRERNKTRFKKMPVWIRNPVSTLAKDPPESPQVDKSEDRERDHSCRGKTVG